MMEILYKESDLLLIEDIMDDLLFKSMSLFLDVIFRRCKWSLGIGLWGVLFFLKGNFYEF